jgi:hypothetical protein
MFVVRTPALGDTVCQSAHDARRVIIGYVLQTGDELALRDVNVFDTVQGRLRAAVELLVAAVH